MSRRVVAGKRANGDTGLFVSPPGVDAYTAPDSSLVLSVGSKVSQLVLLGSVPSSQLISIGLGQRPIVLVTSYNSITLTGAVSRTGVMRPSPWATGQPGATVTINSGGASMTISTTLKATYAVYAKAF